jgi:hypothetical protein
MIHALGLGYFLVRFRFEKASIGSVSENFPGLLPG